MPPPGLVPRLRRPSPHSAAAPTSNRLPPTKELTERGPARQAGRGPQLAAAAQAGSACPGASPEGLPGRAAGLRAPAASSASCRAAAPCRRGQRGTGPERPPVRGLADAGLAAAAAAPCLLAELARDGLGGVSLPQPATPGRLPGRRAIEKEVFPGCQLLIAPKEETRGRGSGLLTRAIPPAGATYGDSEGMELARTLSPVAV